MHNKQDVDPTVLFKFKRDAQTLRPTRASSKPYALVEPNPRYDIRRNFFTVRVIRHWNNLPEEIQCASSINAFKNSFHKYFSPR